MKKIIILISLFSLSVQVEHCFIEQPVCKTCKEGYYLVSNKFCSKIEHCTFMSGGLCSSCEEKYKLNDDRTACVPKSEDDIIEHCLSSYNNFNYESNTYNLVCEKCESGYALNQDEDQCVTSPFDGCQKVKADDSTQCDKCLWDYYQLKDDQCSIESSDFCEEYDDNGDCEKMREIFLSR